MVYDSIINAWCIKDGNGQNVFIFYMDGSIGFPKANPVSRLRFGSDGALEISDGTNWRKIPFTYGSSTYLTSAVTGEAVKHYGPSSAAKVK